MRTVVAGLVAVAAGLVLPAPVAAVPPEDLAAYCRAAYPQTEFQLRCLNVETAAAERVARAAARADRDAFSRCLGASPSWAAMEICLAQVARGGPLPSAGGPVSMAPPAVDQGARRPGQGAGPPTDVARDLPGVVPPAAAPEAAVAPSPSTTVLGPAPSLPSTALAEPERPPRPISEADADRHLRGVLERVGLPAARCMKKQYGRGWASICQ